jgi:hypothetical protein
LKFGRHATRAQLSLGVECLHRAPALQAWLQSLAPVIAAAAVVIAGVYFLISGVAAAVHAAVGR